MRSEWAVFVPVCLQRSLPAVTARGCHHENVRSHGGGTDSVGKQKIVYPIKQNPAHRLLVHTDGMHVNMFLFL